MTATKEAFLAVVQHGDNAPEETELVNVETDDAGLLTIELTDGTRITCVEPVGPSAGRAAA
jgi:hypothetical protein